MANEMEFTAEERERARRSLLDVIGSWKKIAVDIQCELNRLKEAWRVEKERADRLEKQYKTLEDAFDRECEDIDSHYKFLGCSRIDETPGELPRVYSYRNDRAEAAEAALKEAGRWIRVEERLPEPWQMVLAIGSRFDIPRIVYRPRLDDGRVKWFRDANNQREYVTHWQPLSAPPSSQDDK